MWKLLLLALPLALPTATSPVAQDSDSITKRYHECSEKQDVAGLVTLGKEHPGAILYTIDADLEGSLKLVESSDSPDMDAVRALHERALFGAACAEEATGRPIFVEYASSFVGWTAEQQKDFRAGQKAFGAARAAMKEGKFDDAAASGRKCTELAEPLGDWWGTAMGLSVEGGALAQGGKHEAALVPLTRARMIYHDLGLTRAEYGTLRTLAETLVALDRKPRARATLRQAAAMAGKLGDEEGQRKFEELAKTLGE